MLKTKAAARRGEEGRHPRPLRGRGRAERPQVYDLVLVAVGRTPNGKRIGAEKAGVDVDDRGFIPVDKQMRTNVAHIFAIGDIACQPMLAHKAVHEGHVAAEVAAGKKSFFDARQIPSVAYTDPEIAWAGKTEDELKADGVKFAKAVFPWAASGRATRQRPRRGLHQAALRRGDTPHHRRRHRRRARRRSHQRDLPRHRDGRRRDRHRQDHPPAPDAVGD